MQNINHTAGLKPIVVLIFFAIIYLKGIAQNPVLDKISSLRNSALYDAMTNIEKAQQSLDEAIELAQKYEYYNVVVGCAAEKAEYAGWNGNLSDFHLFLKEGQEFFNKNQLAEDLNYLKLQQIWGIYYYKTGALKIGQEYFQQVSSKLTQIKELNPEHYNLLNSTYQWLADMQVKQGNYDEALETFYYSREFEVKKAELLNETPNLKHHDRQIARIYSRKKEYKKAEEYYIKSLKAFEKDFEDPNHKKARLNSVISLYKDLGVLYRKIGNLEKSLSFFDKSLELQKFHNTFKGATYYEQGNTYASGKLSNRAITFYNKSITEFETKYKGQKNVSTARSMTALGDVFFDKDDFEKALSFYQSALIQVVRDFNSEHISETPRLDQEIISDKELLNILGKKSRALYEYGRKHNDSNIHQLAWQNSQRAIDLIENIRKDYSSDLDKQFLTAESYPVFEQAIQIAFEMGEPYYEKAFEFAEKCKAVTLLEAVNKTRAENYAGLKPSELEKLNLLKAKLVILDQNIFRAKNEEEIASLKKKKFLLKKQYQSQIAQLEKDNPKYYELKFQNKVVSSAEIREQLLEKDQSLISYFLGDEDLFIFLIDPNQEGIQVFKEDWNSTLTAYASNIKEDIFMANDADYCHKAYSLYEKLLKPVFKQCHSKNLVLIPDGVLGYIPFDALLTQPVDGQVLNFRELPYLMEDRNISQCFSASMLKIMKKEGSAFTKSRLLVYAPAFRKVKRDQPKLMALRNDLDTLLFNEPEGLKIKSLLGGEFKRNWKATKTQFLQDAPHYNILHIASHAKVNDQSPNFSYIAFSNLNSEKEENHKLYVRELYDRQLPADLVVLSACETGTGKVSRGEGIISIARAFTHAGAKSITTTLWNINDKQTQNLMSYYYQNLAEGIRKDEALSNAKQQYIKEAEDQERAHPRYWAAFNTIGDTRPLETMNSFSFKYFLTLITLGLVAGVFWRKRSQFRA